jgi:RNA polymerase sigma-70 factor (ECF subfamily)
MIAPPTRAEESGVDERRRRFERQVVPHIDAGYNLARWLTRNDHDAEDVVQDAVLRAYRHFDGLRGEARPWLLAIVRNACMDWLKANRPAEFATFDEHAVPDDAAEQEGPEAAAIRDVERRLLHEAIAALPVQFREVLILREIEDLSYRDIARIAELPIGTVMSRLARARRLLFTSLRAIFNASGVAAR